MASWVKFVSADSRVLSLGYHIKIGERWLRKVSSSDFTDVSPVLLGTSVSLWEPL